MKSTYGKMLNLTEKVKEFVSKIWKSEEFVWKHEGFIYFLKKVKNFHGKMTNSPGQAKEFIWSNGILSIGFLTSTVF